MKAPPQWTSQAKEVPFPTIDLRCFIVNFFSGQYPPNRGDADEEERDHLRFNFAHERP